MITVGLAVGGVAASPRRTSMRGASVTRAQGCPGRGGRGRPGSLSARTRSRSTPRFPCVSSVAERSSPGRPAHGGWCPALEGTAGDATYSYRVRPAEITELISRIEIVSTGTSNWAWRAGSTFSRSRRGRTRSSPRTRDRRGLRRPLQPIERVRQHGHERRHHDRQQQRRSVGAGAVRRGERSATPRLRRQRLPAELPIRQRPRTLSLPRSTRASRDRLQRQRPHRSCRTPSPWTRSAATAARCNGTPPAGR